MRSLTVVKGEVCFRPWWSAGTSHSPKVDVLVFDAPPQALHKDVVQSSAATIHADTDASAFKCALESYRSEWTP